MKESIQVILKHLHGLPALEQTVFPGDKVVLALAAGMVAAASESTVFAELVVELATVLHEQVFDEKQLSGGVSILIDETEEWTVGPKLKAALPEGVRFLIHRPAAPGSLALLGTNAADEPIALAREMVESDIVIPVTLFDSGKKPDYCRALFPRFSDQEARNRVLNAKGTAKKICDQAAQEAAARLGILLCVFIEKKKNGSPVLWAGLPDEVVAQFSKPVKK